MTETFTFRNNQTQEEFSYPILQGSMGPSVVDIRKFYGDTGFFTYDPGYTSTGSCKSSLTYIDGDQGILLHAGYPISKLAENYSYLEVVYLLLKKNLPNAQEKENFESQIAKESFLPDYLLNILASFEKNHPPMSILCTLVAALSAHYHNDLDITNPEHRFLTAVRCVAKIPLIIALIHRHQQGKKIFPSKPEFGYVENFLYMFFADDQGQYIKNAAITQAMNKIFILHADHEQNASTSTVRLSGSSGANPYACLAAGIATLWGPAHGGANEAVLDMLKKIGDISQIDHYISRAKDKNDSFRIMGFGHRVYKNYDPRAKILSQANQEILKIVGIKDSPLLKVAQKLEEIALKDAYFIEKKLYPNIDFYSGIIFQALHIPTNIFTCFFALARTSGWISQWIELMEDKEQKIGRPRQLYIGSVPK